MFVIYLEFAENRDRAAALMDGHKDWLQQGFDDGVFLAAGSPIAPVPLKQIERGGRLFSPDCQACRPKHVTGFSILR